MTIDEKVELAKQIVDRVEWLGRLYDIADILAHNDKHITGFSFDSYYCDENTLNIIDNTSHTSSGDSGLIWVSTVAHVSATGVGSIITDEEACDAIDRNDHPDAFDELVLYIIKSIEIHRL